MKNDNLQIIIEEVRGMRTDLQDAVSVSADDAMAMMIARASLSDCKSIVDLLVKRVSDLVGLAPELEDASCALQDAIDSMEA